MSRPASKGAGKRFPTGRRRCPGAHQHALNALTRKDRRKLDRKLWTYVDSRISLERALHLDEQWGAEGTFLSRSVQDNVEHVETCIHCRLAYEAVTKGTTLTCGSKKVGYQLPKPKPRPDENQGSTIPP